MSFLLVGVSHKTAPLSELDQIAAQTDSIAALRDDIASSPFVAEVMAIGTCNRLEIIADVARFHGAVTDIAIRLGKHTGLAVEELTTHLYVHFEERAVHHVFTVTSGLDSMIVGEQQILGQVRSALKDAQAEGNAGRSLNELAQSALRVGKRVHTETGIDRHGASVVSVALAEATRKLGSLDGLNVLVIGAGAMSSLALQTISTTTRVASLSVMSRTAESTQRAAEHVNAMPLTMSDLGTALAQADVVVTATGANGLIVTFEDVEAAVDQREGRPLVFIDLAMPHDTDPQIQQLPGVTRIDLSDLAQAPGAFAPTADLEAAKAIVDDEVHRFLAQQAALRVEPIVVSLRAKADVVLEAELQRLRLKSPELSDAAIAMVEQTLRRTVSTLLHTPTVRMKQFAADPDGQRYAEALRTLFDLNPESISSLSVPSLEDDAQKADVSSYADLESRWLP